MYRSLPFRFLLAACAAFFAPSQSHADPTPYNWKTYATGAAVVIGVGAVAVYASRHGKDHSKGKKSPPPPKSPTSQKPKKQKKAAKKEKPQPTDLKELMEIAAVAPEPPPVIEPEPTTLSLTLERNELPDDSSRFNLYLFNPVWNVVYVNEDFTSTTTNGNLFSMPSSFPSIEGEYTLIAECVQGENVKGSPGEFILEQNGQTVTVSPPHQSWNINDFFSASVRFP